MQADIEYFQWSELFETGVSQVDKQHQSLVLFINDFGRRIAENNIDKAFLTQSAKELTRYANTHFSTEEQLMAEKQLDEHHVSLHKKQHTDFINEVATIVDTLHTLDQESGKTLFQYLVNWLIYHILCSDKNMANQIEAIDQGQDPLTAYIYEEKTASVSTEPLLKALNGLFMLLSKRNQALSHLNKSLERLVAERTADLVEANETLETLSITDHLTGLHNRRYAMNQLALLFREAKKKKEPFACIMVDADGFKVINDTYGHDAGDLVLQQLSQALTDSVRSDDIVCRMGGDEFVILCPNTGLAGASKLAEQVHATINGLCIKAGRGTWHGSISIGVASITKDYPTPHDILRAADNALYQAKKAGRNCVRTV